MANLMRRRHVTPITVVALAFAVMVVALHQTLLAEGKGETKPGSKITLTIDGLEFTFCYIPAGTFMMGSPDSEKGHGQGEKLHKVVISKPFYMLENEVTQEQFGKEPTRETPFDGSHFRGAKLPAENRVFPDGAYTKFTKAMMKATGKKLRLPTEAEWEYACRAGTTTPFNWGHDLDATLANMDGHDPYGNGVKDKFRNKTMEVKQFKPNAWGLYDMHGNVAELCVDYVARGADPYVDCITDPGAADPDAIQVSVTTNANGIAGKWTVRGGSYWSSGSECRSAAHDNTIADPRNGADFIGFRLVLIP